MAKTEVFDLTTELEFEPEQAETVGEIIPCPTDPGWSDYAISKLADDEKLNGYPTVEGLRRVAELLIGDIMAIRTNVVQAPNLENDKRATVVCTIIFDNGKEFDGAADVFWGNCDKPFYKYPVAIAETRAEGRALRKALKLKKIVVAEEMSVVAEDENATSPDSQKVYITDTQINFIDLMCKRLDINVQKSVNKDNPELHNIKELEHSKSLVLQKSLSTYQQAKDTIPTDIVGYDADWRQTFG